MDRNTVFAKTSKGMEEAEKRTYKIDIRSRAALLAVNGTDTVETIIKRFHGLEQLVSLLNQLAADGFIAEVAGKGGVASKAGASNGGKSEAQNALREIVSRIHGLLGPDGDMVTEKLEDLGETANNPAVLLQFLQQRREMFEDIAGKQKAARFFEDVQKLLS